MVVIIMIVCHCVVSIKGGELFEFIETEGRVDEDVTVRLLRQVLEGVHFLHSHNILHMDIKVQRTPVLGLLVLACRCFLSV